MFDDIIRDKANEHSAPVPPDAWDNIEKKKKKRLFAFWWWGAGLLLLLGISGVWMYANKNTPSHSVADTTTVSKKDSPEAKATNSTGSSGTAQQQVSSPTEYATGDTEKKEAEILAGNTGKTATIKGSTSAKATILIADAEIGDDNRKSVSVSTGKNRKTDSRCKWKQQPASVNEPIDGEKTSNAIAGDLSATKDAVVTEEKPVVITDKKNTTAVNSSGAAVQPDSITTIAATTVDKPVKKDDSKNSIKEIKTQNKQSKKQHWYLDAGCMPVVALQRYDVPVSFNRTLFLNNNLTQYNASLISTSIEPSVAFSLAVRKDISKKISVGTGFQYLLLKEKISISGKETTTTYSTVQRLQNGVFVTDTVATVQEGTRSIHAVNSYQLYSIPVFLQYCFLQGKQWNLSAAAGLYFNISAQYQNSINDNATAMLINSTHKEEGASLGYDLFTGIRLAKSFGNRLELFAMPSLRWSINNPVVKNSLINNTIHQAGLGIGITYRLF